MYQHRIMIVQDLAEQNQLPVGEDVEKIANNVQKILDEGWEFLTTIRTGSRVAMIVFRRPKGA